MKRFLIVTLCSLLFSMPAMAIEYVSTMVDGSRIFRCEYEGKEYKVKVKDRGDGSYMVLRYGIGATNFSGVVYSPSHAEAAKNGCGER